MPRRRKTGPTAVYVGTDGSIRKASLNVVKYVSPMPKCDPADAESVRASYDRWGIDSKNFQRGQKVARARLRGQVDDVGTEWMRGQTGFNSDQCLYFPHSFLGREAAAKYNFKVMRAARVMLLLTQGLPADKGHALATHLCGCGHLSCVNPKHLRWGSQRDNSTDLSAHSGRSVPIEGMDQATVEAIRASGKLVNVLALEYGLPAGVVSAIKLNKQWRQDDSQAARNQFSRPQISPATPSAGTAPQCATA